MEVLLRALIPLSLAVFTAWGVVHMSTIRRIQPPGFLVSDAEPSNWRRMLFLLVFSVGLFLTVFQSVALLGIEPDTDLSEVSTAQLFFVHWILLAMLGAWYVLGFGGLFKEPRGVLTEWWRQFGLDTRPRTVHAVGRELLLGLGLGVVGWFVVLLLMSVVAMLVTTFGGSDLLPQEVPPSIVWMASLSFPLRLAIATSAGVVEELFFRGFLQPRIGIALSSLLFVLAHLAYGQPFLLIGVTLLSFGFAFLARWRGNIWAAIAAHFTFDAVQLLILIPAALGAVGEV